MDVTGIEPMTPCLQRLVARRVNNLHDMQKIAGASERDSELYLERHNGTAIRPGRACVCFLPDFLVAWCPPAPDRQVQKECSPRSGNLRERESFAKRP